MLHVFTCYTSNVNNQNITLKIDAGLVKKVKVVAAEKGTSISAFLAARLEELVGEDAAYQDARRKALRRMERGVHLGAGALTRQHLHGGQ